MTDASSYSRPWPITGIMRAALGKNLFTVDEEAWIEQAEHIDVLEAEIATLRARLGHLDGAAA